MFCIILLFVNVPSCYTKMHIILEVLNSQSPFTTMEKNYGCEEFVSPKYLWSNMSSFEWGLISFQIPNLGVAVAQSTVPAASFVPFLL